MLVQERRWDASESLPCVHTHWQAKSKQTMPSQKNPDHVMVPYFQAHSQTISLHVSLVATELEILSGLVFCFTNMKAVQLEWFYLF